MKQRLTFEVKLCFHCAMSNQSEALERAKRAAGNGASLARALGITAQALSQWDEVPPLRVLDVERFTGVPRHELRPDLYPPPLVPQHEQAAE